MAKNKVETLLTAKDKTGPAFKTANSSMTKLKASSAGLAKMLAPLAAAVSVGVIANMGKQALDSADSIAKMSERIGASTEALSQYQHAAAKSGIEFKTLTMGWQRMTRRVSEAAHGFGEARGALIELEVSAKHLNRLAPDQQFEALADSIMKVEGPADRVRLAMKLFDSEGVSLIQMMGKGSAGLREMTKEADDAGLTLTALAAQKVVDAKDAMADLDSSVKGLSLSMATDLAPAVTELADDLIPLVRGMGKLAAFYSDHKPRMKTRDDMTGIAEATKLFADSLNAIPDSGSVFSPAYDAPNPFDSSGLKDNSFPESWEHEHMMLAISDTEELVGWWASLSPTLEAVSNTATNSRSALDDLTVTADQVGIMVGEAGEDGAGRMADALASAVAEGKLELLDLGRVAQSVFGEIFSGFLKMGIRGLFAAATGGASEVGGALGFVGASPIVGVPGLSGMLGASPAGGAGVQTMNVTFNESMNLQDPVVRRQVAKELYTEIQTVASHHGPEA